MAFEEAIEGYPIQRKKTSYPDQTLGYETVNTERVHIFLSLCLTCRNALPLLKIFLRACNKFEWIPLELNILSGLL